MTGSDRERDVAVLVEVILARYLAGGYNQELQTPLTREDIADDSGHMFYARAYAEAVLASDWLAAHDKAVADEAAGEALDQRNEALDGLSDRTRAKWEAEDRYAALVDKVRALADKWAAEDDMTQWGSHDKYACARRLRALLEADQ